MKIRIHGNSVRFRLSKPEVAKLEQEGYLEETTDFGASQFDYAVRKTVNNALNAVFEQSKITLHVPESLLTGWTENSTVGFEENMPLGNGSSLYLLIEKDFKCLDNTHEDQSDNYDNPNQTC
ncbi:hypothetical protein GCM10010967_39940 [Dyadobacter beijingensis]|uniref:Uncharacterized protein n=1 Tax=Dyadobacter beijingensis TaxID=365489 RepID=A0ABQ2I8U8_9BACT|nr:hypothetical protein [Dyadobacter beijingensis]GGN01531.1 hypothetical protein GCM10010967_39940 [Dyadobacter beijingensis]